MAHEVDIDIKRSNTKPIILTLYKPETYEIQSIAGWTTFQLGVSTVQFPPSIVPPDVATLIGSLLTDGTDGKITFTNPGTIAAGNYFYDAKAIDANSKSYTFAEGRFTVEANIT